MTGVVGEVDALARLRRTACPETAHARQGAGQRRQAKAGHAGQRARGQADGLRRVRGGRGIGLRRGAHGGVSGAVQTEVWTGRRHGASPGRGCRALGGGGHRTVAGAQLQGMTIEEAKQAILEHALDALHSAEQEEEQQ